MELVPEATSTWYFWIEESNLRFKYKDKSNFNFLVNYPFKCLNTTFWGHAEKSFISKHTYKSDCLDV